MQEDIANPKTMQASVSHLTRYAVYILILLPIVAGVAAYGIWKALPSSSSAGDAQTPATVISTQMLEERFGLRITLIAVTAGGGIVDVRYKILDSDKAAHVLDDPDGALYLVIEESGATLEQAGHAMKHNTELENNASYFIFFPNTQNAVRPGTPVSVAFGSVRVEPIIAQ